ncbi:MAG: condensation domain-containing protein, partial [Gemmatimonadaceae bacterium]
MSEMADPAMEYALSPLQEGMLFQWRVERSAGTDIEQIVGELNESIDVQRLEHAWQRAVASFSMLRTAFRWEGLERPLQHVVPHVPIAFVAEDLTALSLERAERRISDFLDADRLEGFDLGRAPAMRVRLFQIAASHFRIVWTVHHILIDGRSFGAVLNHVFGTYDGLPVAHDDRPYREYIEWTERRDHAEARAFWKTKLAGFHAPTPLPFDNPPAKGSARLEERRVKFSMTVTQQLRDLAAREGLTLNTVLMAAWGLMLSRYAGETDVIFGATKSTRRGTIPGADSVAGLFLATVPVRLQADPQLSVLAWLRRVRDEWVSLRGQEHLPLVDIRAAGGVSTPRLFDSLYVYEHRQFGSRLQSQGGAWSSRHFDILHQSGFPLTLAAHGEDELTLRLEGAGGRFHASTIELLVGQLTTLLTRWATDPTGQVRESTMLSADERHNVLTAWNNTTTEYPRDRFIH